MFLKKKSLITFNMLMVSIVVYCIFFRFFRVTLQLIVLYNYATEEAVSAILIKNLRIFLNVNDLLCTFMVLSVRLFNSGYMVLQ